MPKLPVLSGEELIKALEKAGFKKVRQKGRHISLQKGEYKTVVPMHDELALYSFRYFETEWFEPQRSL